MIGLYFTSIVILFYIYLGYPLLIFFMSHFYKREVRKGPLEPSVSILISAYNEARCIRSTIENKLSLEYPADKIEIIVVSDGSDDGTDEIVKSISDKRIKFIRQNPRKGKTSALNHAVAAASGEILVFSDANSIYEPGSLRYLLENFADPSVGYVTGKMIYVNTEVNIVGDGCSAYMKYENLLRELETRIGSIVGVDGGIDACRKSLYWEMRSDQLPDFVLPLKVVEQGHRVVFEPRALLEEETLKSPGDENRMRVRVSLRALWALFDMRTLLNPLRHGVFSFQLFSHKVLRYLGILFVFTFYTSNIFIIPRSLIYKLTFVFQNMMVFSALAAYFIEKRGKLSGPLYIPYYFYLVNLAAGRALVKFLRGEKQVVWTPRKG